MDRKSLDELSERVIGAVFEVANSLGAGFLEKVYERALLRVTCSPKTKPAII